MYTVYLSKNITYICIMCYCTIVPVCYQKSYEKRSHLPFFERLRT